MEPGAGEPPMPRLQAGDGLALSGGALPRPPGGAEEGDEPGQDGAVEGSTELAVATPDAHLLQEAGPPPASTSVVPILRSIPVIGSALWHSMSVLP